MTRILLIDKTGDAEVCDSLAEIAYALTRQANDDFAPAWNIGSVSVGASTAEAAGAWSCFIVPALDVPDALAYHTTIGGDPVLYVGWNVIRDNGGTIKRGSLSLSAAASHEILETLADEFCDYWANWIGDPSLLVALEVCDPVQGDSYDEGAVSVSNFVLPTWFREGSSAAGFDFLDVLDGPNMISPGGYLVFSDGSQMFGDEVPEWKRELVKKFSRRPRRALTA